MALKPKAKSFELEILSEAEIAQDKVKSVQPRDEARAPHATVMSKRWHAGVDIEALPAMTKAEEVVFDMLRARGTYLVVIKKGRKYVGGGGQVGLDQHDIPLKTSIIEGFIKKGWLERSVRDDVVGYFVTSHMVYAWRKLKGI